MVFVPNTPIVAIAMSLAAMLLSTACGTTETITDTDISVTTANEEVQFSAGPALWRVSDEDTQIYILGMADLIPPGTDWQSVAFMNAFEKADIIILETDERQEAQAGLGPVVQELGLFNDGRTLLDVLSEEQIEKINEVSTSLGAPLQALAPLKPWLAAVQLGALSAVQQGYQNYPSGLLVLATQAEAAGKPMQFFEKTREQLLRIIASLPEETHVNMLVNAARQISEKPTQGIDVVPFWVAGDVDELAMRYHGEGQWADEVLYDALLIQRNLDWVQRIKSMLEDKQGVIIIGVGSGHVVGPDSLITMLAQQGVAVSRQ